jgi:hypothetical protein
VSIAPYKRPAKLPPDPAEIARAQEFRDLLKELIHTGAELAFAIAAQGIAEAKAAPPEPASQPPAAHPQNHAAPATPQSPASGPDAPPNSPRPLAAATCNPALIYAHLLRGIQGCIKLDAQLGAMIAKAHKTAEMAGLHHPYRQPILDYLHEAIRDEDPWQFQRVSHNEIEIRVSEELGYAPRRNPGDIIGQLCQHFRLPNNPADYPNNWRPSRPWPDD